MLISPQLRHGVFIKIDTICHGKYTVSYSFTITCYISPLSPLMENFADLDSACVSWIPWSKNVPELVNFIIKPDLQWQIYVNSCIFYNISHLRFRFFSMLMDMNCYCHIMWWCILIKIFINTMFMFYSYLLTSYHLNCPV